MSRTVVVVCHRAAPSECSWPLSRATRIDPGSGSDWRSAGAVLKQTMELSACATYPAQAVFSLSTSRGAHWLSAASSFDHREHTRLPASHRRCPFPVALRPFVWRETAAHSDCHESMLSVATQAR